MVSSLCDASSRKCTPTEPPCDCYSTNLANLLSHEATMLKLSPLGVLPHLSFISHSVAHPELPPYFIRP